jgi:hypothetical protein
LQIEILRLLADGGLMTIDGTNSSHIGERSVQFQTRCFLTSHRLITALDRTKNIATAGNGFVISERGIRALRDSCPSEQAEQPGPSVSSGGINARAARFTSIDGMTFTAPDGTRYTPDSIPLSHPTTPGQDAPGKPGPGAGPH